MHIFLSVLLFVRGGVNTGDEPRDCEAGWRGGLFDILVGRVWECRVSAVSIAIATDESKVTVQKDYLWRG